MSYTKAGQWGPNAIDRAGTGVPLASTSVKIKNTDLTLATLYTDDTKGTEASNPATTDAFGNLTIYAAPGVYKLVAVVNGVEQTALDIEVLPDPADLVHTAGAQTIAGVKTFSDNPVFNDDAIPEAKVSGLTEALALKAVDNAVVHLAGTETVSGAKRFSSTLSVDGVFTVKGVPHANILHPAFGAVADGSTDVGPALQAANDHLNTTYGGGVILVPPSLLGFKAATTTVLSSNVTVDGVDSALIINDATSAYGNNLFQIQDVDNVTVRRLRVEAIATGDFTGGRNPQKAIELSGIITNICLEDLILHDHQSFAITFDGSVDPTVDYYDGLYLKNIRITGDCGPVGDGSGIDLFPRSESGAYPLSRNLYMENIFIDVSRGVTDQAEHGPQCIKISNTKGIVGSNIICRGGDVAALTLTNGCQDFHFTNVHTYLSNRGMAINNAHSVATTRTRGGTLTGFSYDPENVSGSPDKYSLVIGEVQDLAVNGFTVQGDIRFIADGGDSDIVDCSISDGAVRNGNIAVTSPGSAWQADTAYALGTIIGEDGGRFKCTTAGTSDSVEPTWPSSGTVADNTVVWTRIGGSITGLRIHDVQLTGGAGTSKGLVLFGDANWLVSNSQIHNMILRSHDGHGISIVGNDNQVDGVTSISGNPDNDASRAVILDSGSRNIVGAVTLAGTHEVDWFYRSSGGSNTVITGPFVGTPVTALISTVNGTETVLVRLSGADTPEGAVVGRIGSTWQRTNGGVGTALYAKTSGTGNTGWTAMTGATAQTYAASNVSTDRAYDADATTTEELADVLGTLIADLRAAGVVV